MKALIFIEANGKAHAWARITRKLGMTAQVVATTGHVCSFPNSLYPIGIDLSRGAKLERLREPIPEKRDMILAAVAKQAPGTAIVIATDDDVEGDVIAYDLAEMIFRAYPDRTSSIVRVRPGPITAHGIRQSLSTAKSLNLVLPSMTTEAIPGRARAVTDRWIGATFSKLAGVPVGRVRSAILGATYLLNRLPKRLRGMPETGEIRFQARSGTGGRPFVARVALNGNETSDYLLRLKRLAIKFSMRIIPGVVRPMQSLSAAVAPRVGTVRPFNTVDALVYASRHHQVPIKLAMQGLQDAYLQGMISYPRTDSRHMSRESASRVTMLGFGCGLEGLEIDVLSDAGSLGNLNQRQAHEGLHPVILLATGNTDQLRELVRRPLRKPDGGWDRATVMEAMTVLIARRAFEASREITLERGNWAPDNGGETDIDPADMDLLRDLEWTRDKNFAFPWTRNYSTGINAWPMDGVLLELMAEEGIGRPSTYASHIETAMGSGDLLMGEFPAPPRPSPQGIQALKKMPVSVWNPAICRLIEDALENRDNFIGEDPNASLQERARHRVLSWFRKVPDDIRNPLLEALSEKSGEDRGLSGMIRGTPGTRAPDYSEIDVPALPAEPSPFNT